MEFATPLTRGPGPAASGADGTRLGTGVPFPWRPNSASSHAGSDPAHPRGYPAGGPTRRRGAWVVCYNAGHWEEQCPFMTPERARASSPRARGGPARADDGRRRCSNGNHPGSRLGGARPPRGGTPPGGLRDRRWDEDRGGVAPGDPRWVGRRRKPGGGRRRRRRLGKRLRGSLLRGLPTEAVHFKLALQPAYIMASRQRAT